MKIGAAHVGTNNPPFIIAEMSGNHNGSLDRALELVRLAADSGASAVKLQTYTPDTMTLNIASGEFRIDDPDSPWNGSNLYELYAQAQTPWEWHGPIFALCRELGIQAFSSPFDETAVDFLETLDPPCYKIASFENIDIALIRRVAQTGKPMIISTGMATAGEIALAVATAREQGCTDLVLLKCSSTYPADPVYSNLNTIRHMREQFQCEVGLSDHTLGIGTAIAAIAMGATVIEKHFTSSRADGGVDSAFSLEADELAQLVRESERAWRSLGGVSYGPTQDDENSLVFRRSLYIVEDLKAGDVLTPENVRAIRPGLGLPPKYLDTVLARQITVDIPRGTPLKWDHLLSSFAI